MFGKLQDFMKQLQAAQQLMKDEDVKALVAHPKVQALFQDSNLQAIIKSQDSAKIMSHPKLMALLRDPEIAPLLSRVNPQTFLKT